MVNYESSKQVANFHTLDTGTKTGDITEVLIPLSSVLEANARYENSLGFGMFISYLMSLYCN